MSFLLGLLLFLPCAVNLSFSACAAWCFRKYPRPPLWVIIFLLILGAGTIRLLFIFDFGYSFTLWASLSSILSIVQAVALGCRRQFGNSFLRSWGVSSLLVLPVVVWVDLRFSVLVMDADGNAVEVDASQIQMQASSTSIFSWGYSTLHYGYGNRLKKVVVYFGFCQWVTQRGNWLIYGDAVSPEGELLLQQGVNCKANWWSWPLRITVDPKSP